MTEKTLRILTFTMEEGGEDAPDMIVIDEDEWEERYEWLPNEDGEWCLQNSVPDDVPDEFVWTQIDAPYHNGYFIVPGRMSGIGYYICARPHNYDAEVEIPPAPGADGEDDEPYIALDEWLDS